MKQPRRGSNSSVGSTKSDASDHHNRGTEAAFEAVAGAGGLEAVPFASQAKDAYEVYSEIKEGKKASAATTALGVAADTFGFIPGLGGGIKYLADTARGEKKLSSHELLYSLAPGGRELDASQRRALGESSSGAVKTRAKSSLSSRSKDSSLLSRAAQRTNAATRFLREDEGVSSSRSQNSSLGGLRRRQSGRGAGHGSGMGHGYS